MSERTRPVELALAALRDPAPGTWVEVATPSQIEDQPGSGSESAFPIGVKANIAVRGFRRSAACALLDGSAEEADAEVVALCRRAGAVVVGMTNMHELAFGIDSVNATFGPVRLPGHPERSAGGSSGGSAAAVASGEVPVALGTDTGGSVSIPASLCGIVGFRPSTGRWPGGGIIGLSSTRDTPGVLAHSVSEVARVDRVVTDDSPGLAGAQRARSGRPRLGLPVELLADLDPATRAAFRGTLEEIGGVFELQELSFSEILDSTRAAEMPLVLWESHRLLSDIAAEALGLDPVTAFDRLVDGVASPDVRAILQSEQQSPVSAEEYQAAQRHTGLARAEYARLLDRYDLDALVFPTTPAPAPLITTGATLNHLGKHFSTFELYTRNTGPGTVLGAPMVTIPARVSAGALPVGVTVQGRRFDDRHTLELGALVEAALGHAS